MITEYIVVIIDSVVKSAKITDSYIVEVENCETNHVLYSYKIVDIDSINNVSCRASLYSTACYQIFVTLFDSGEINMPFHVIVTPVLFITPSFVGRSNYLYVVIFSVITMIGFAFYFKMKSRSVTVNSDIIVLGQYYFDKKEMSLQYKSYKIEHSSKETDLHYLLSSVENETLERNHILNKVRGDEDDYVGRTLDVFISKLRKKLDADANLKIVNVRE